MVLRKAKLAISALCFGLVTLCLSAEPAPSQPNSGWSQDLLTRLLASPDPAAAATPSNTDGAAGVARGDYWQQLQRATSPSDPQAAASDGMVMRSYQFRHLRLGEPGRATHLVSILKRLLSADSTVSEDRGGNLLHVFTHAGAQNSVAELLSSMDIEEGAAQGAVQAPEKIPEEVKKALTELAAARPNSQSLLTAIREFQEAQETRIKETLRQSAETTHSETRHLLIVGGLTVGTMLFLGVLVVVVVGSRVQKKLLSTKPAVPSGSLALAPQSVAAVMAAAEESRDQITAVHHTLELISIQFQAGQTRQEKSMELLNQRHNEVSQTLSRLNELRQELSANSAGVFLEMNRDALNALVQSASDQLRTQMAAVSEMTIQATQKLDQTADRIDVQQLRLQQVADELEKTQSECDRLQSELQKALEKTLEAENEANKQRDLAADRAAALARKEATIAGLSILMQEPVGQILDTINEQRPEAGADPTPAENVISNVVSFDQQKGVPPTAAEAVSQPGPDAAPLSECPPKYTYRIQPAS